MSLAGSNPMDVLGVVRNAQLVKWHLPGWTLRVYTECPQDGPRHPVPSNVLNKLALLGTEVVFIHKSISVAPVGIWSFLVVDDVTVDRFIVRRGRSRLNDRDAKLVQEWIDTDKPVHCIRDHPGYSSRAMTEHLWGGKAASLRQMLGKPMTDLLLAAKNDSSSTFMTNVVWPAVKGKIVCHDSVSCKKWEGSRPIPSMNVTNGEYLGQLRGAFGEYMKVNGAWDVFSNRHNFTDCRI